MTVAEAKALTPEELYSMTDVWCLPGEEWKNIPGYDYYQVSTYGRIRSLDHWKVARPDHKKPRLFVGKVLVPGLTETGYLAINVCRDGEKRQFRKLHRMVIETFIPNTENLPVINHKDENKVNNRIENLEWCTIKYNSNYDTGQQRSHEAIKQFWLENGRHVVQYDLDGNFIKEYPNISVAVEETGITNISNCCCHRHETACGYVFRYKDEPFSYTPPKRCVIPIVCLTLDGKFVKKYNSTADATNELGLKSKTSISRVLKGRNKQCCGYFWMYESDYLKQQNEKISSTKCDD